jgi:phage terminase large subunit
MQILGAFKDAFLSKKRFIICKGGRGSGKSTFIAQKIISRITTEDNLNVLVVRKYYSDLIDSCYKMFKDVIHQENLDKSFHITQSPLHIRFVNGNEIIFNGCDKPEKLKSKVGIGIVWSEEITELDEDEWDDVILIARGRENIQFFASFNPVNMNHWVKKRYFDSYDEDVFISETTFRDNPKLIESDPAYIKYLTESLKSNENLYRVSTLGEWGQTEVGNILFHKFSYSKHIDNLIYSNEKPLHISFDFNSLPTCSATIFQIYGKDIRLIDEITLKHPNNLTINICQEFKKRYKEHKDLVFIYGDSSGMHQDTRTERGVNDFSIILNDLKNYKPILKVPPKNPSVSYSSQFINTIFSDNYDGLNFKIDKKCLATINDLTYGKMDNDGGKLIEKVNDKILGSYEKWHHLNDTIRYFITYAFASEYEKYQRGGESYKITTIKRAPPRNSY